MIEDHAEDNKSSSDEPKNSRLSVNRRKLLLGGAGLATVAAAFAPTGPDKVFAQEAKLGKTAGGNGKKPNILVIWGDDIGWQNVSAYGLGTMGYTTPNIDRIGNEGIKFTDHYAQPSCTAGRAAFITGQYPIRSGMVTVGQPGDKLGLQQASPCLAELMKEQGYATGHFGKSHLGDRNEHLPTNHGFDEFYGNLYHLNVSEEAEQRDYQDWAAAYPGGKDAYEEAYGARGLIHSLATDVDDPTEDKRFGKVGKQKIVDTGPLTRDRMKTVDSEEICPRAMKFMEDAVKADKPFFVWLNTTRGHLYVHLDEKWRYAAEPYTAEYDLAGSGVMEHDHDIGQVLKFLDDNNLTDNTIVWYSTDNGPEHASWPHGQTTPFRGEKMTTYEGGVRVISMLRWPGAVKAGQTLNGIQCHQDMFTTLGAAAGVDDPAAWFMDKKKQYIDGVNNLNYWTGKEKNSQRDHILHYFQSEMTALRLGNWKWHFATKQNYYDDMVTRDFPQVFNIRADPFESYDSKDSYGHLAQKVSWQLSPIGTLVKKHIETLAKYPPVQGGKTFNMLDTINKAMQQIGTL